MLNLPRSSLIIIASAAVMLSLSMGLRQSLGLFMQPVTKDLAVSVSDFTFAIALQNLLWGIFQPVSGALAVRFGFKAIMIFGGVLYTSGLLVLSQAQGQWSILIGAGVLIGIAMSCTAASIAMSVSSRVVSDSQRSIILGIVSGTGSIGALIAAPIGQYLTTDYGWRTGILCFLVLAAIMLPAAWFAGRVDKVPLKARPSGSSDSASAGQALKIAFSEPSFVVMACSYFVCGMQLVFLTTHLPSYLAICGMDPMLSASALGAIGGFNILGSLFFGWAGSRWNKTMLLGMIYISRSFVLTWYFLLPPTPFTTILFASIMGFLWLGVSPLVSSSVAEMFGLRWQAMIQGLAFMSHQLGSFVGAFGGGWMFDMLGSYDLAWRVGVGLGLTAGIVQLIFGYYRPSERFAT